MRFWFVLPESAQENSKKVECAWCVLRLFVVEEHGRPAQSPELSSIQHQTQTLTGGQTLSTSISLGPQ